MAVSRKVGIEFIVDGTSSVERAFSTVSSSATRSAEVVAEASSKQTDAVVAGRVKQIEALRASAAEFSKASAAYAKGSDEQVAASKLAADAQRKLQVALGETAAASAKSGGSFAAFAGRMEASGKKISAVGKKLSMNVTLPIVAVGAVATKMAVDFQNSMELLHTQAGVGQAAVDSLSKSVLKLAGPTATAPDVLATGIYHLTSQGLRGAKALNALKTAAEGAKLGQANLEDVTNALGAVIVSKIGGIHSMSQAMGQLNAIVGAGDMRMQDLADAMGTGLAAAAKVAGVSLDQVGGALATLGDNNIRGAKAATLLISTMRVLGHQSTAAAGALADLGVKSAVLQQKLATTGLTGAIGYLKEKIDASGKSTAQVGSDLSEAFGGKQSTGIKILVAEFARLQTKVAAVRKGGKSFADDWKSYTKTTAYHLASMGAAMQANGVTIGTILLPVVAKIVDFIGRLASRFQALSPNVKKAILIFAGLAAAIGPVVSVIGALVTAVGALAALSGTAAIIIAVAGAVAVLAGAIALAGTKPDLLKSALERMGVSAKAAGRVVADLAETFRVIKAVVEAVWPVIKGVIVGALQQIKGVFEIFGALIHGNWSELWQGIKDIVAGQLHVVLTILRAQIAVLGAVASAVGNAIWNGLKSGAEAAIGWILGKLQAVKDAFDAVVSAFESRPGGSAHNGPGKPQRLHIPGHAAGIFNAPTGHWATVGERGPEAMWVPQGASIIPHGASGSGSSIGMLQAVIPVYLNGRVIGRETRREALRSANRGNDWSRRTLA